MGEQRFRATVIATERQREEVSVARWSWELAVGTSGERSAKGAAMYP
jgi:hypothetical protein